MLPGTIRADFSFNIANSESWGALASGLKRFAPTHDLNGLQIAALADALDDKEAMEVILHHHLPIFHTEHCVFCRFMSSGSR